MSKGYTHMLVAIEPLNKKMESYDSMDLLDDSTKAALIAKAFDNGTPVDLSEEGIEQGAEKFFSKIYGSPYPINPATAGSQGYKQCAKDLLNTKV